MPETSLSQFSQLPDHQRLAQLAQALWRQPGEGPGAALMVGAGFSRNCERATPQSPLPPLWPHLHAALAARLAPSIGSGTPDPLRMAEEFRAYFGQSALNDFIRTHVPDAQWYPGKAHRAVVELPWADLLTTNWDTLLERAALKCRAHNYGIVLRGSDLAQTRSPRIIKLHGTVGDGDGCVFAEDDYRTYATRHAALVNAARQVFIENDVCLLGFSGDDPNFLQWTGWVRDQLGSAARRIYLVGVLALSPASRQLLERRNIVAIDLAPLVQTVPSEQQQAHAITLLLEYLNAAKPTPAHNWEPRHFEPLEADDEGRVDDTVAHRPARLLARLERLEAERLHYPGWMTMPAPMTRLVRWQVDSLTHALWLAQRHPDHFDDDLVIRTALELGWRCTTAFSGLAPATCRILGETWERAQASPRAMEATRLIGPALLRTARERGQGPAFRLWAHRLTAVHDDDLAACVAHETALFALMREDWIALERIQATIGGSDPAWRIRRSRLLFDLGRSDEATALLEQTLEDIRDQMAASRTSIWLRSRRAACQWLLYYSGLTQTDSPYRTYGRELREESPYRCNPADQLRDYSEPVDQAAMLRRAGGESIVAGFSPGSFERKGSPSSSASTDEEPASVFERFRHAAGIPWRIGTVSVVGNAGVEGVIVRKPRTPFASLWPYIRQSEIRTDLIHLTGRVAVARMTARRARFLKRRLLNIIDYWLSRLTRTETPWARTTIPILGCVTLLGRLTARLPESDLVECWTLCKTLTADGRIPLHMLKESVTELAEHAAQAMPKAMRASLALDAISFPYPGEDADRSAPHDSPPGFYACLRSAPAPTERGDQSARWADRIDEVIRGVGVKGSRSGATTLLIELLLDGALSDEEKARFSVALWRLTTRDGLPAETDVVPDVFRHLPAPEGVDVEARLVERLFPADGLALNNPYHLQSLQHAAEGGPGLTVPSALARRLLRQINAEVRSYPDDSGPFTPSRSDVTVVMGTVLGRLVLPRLRPARRSDVDEAFEAVASLRMTRAIEGFPAMLSGAGTYRRDEAVHLIQTHLLSDEWQSVAAACRAIGWWAPEESGQLAARRSAYPSDLTPTVLAALSANRDEGAHFLLELLARMLAVGMLKPVERKLLVATLPSCLALNTYSSVDPLSKRAIGVSLVRMACARLVRRLRATDPSSSLTTLHVMLLNDPLPEVRQALADA